MGDLRSAYHKGKYRSGEWARHLRPYLKRAGNKRWRKDSKHMEVIEPLVRTRRAKTTKKHIKVRITKEPTGGWKFTSISKYRILRDAKNAMRQAHVIRAEFI